jgi:hypothetical protein
MRNSEVAVKNVPAIGLLNCLVTTTVMVVVASAEIAAATKFSRLPRPTSASWSRSPRGAVPTCAVSGVTAER